MARIGINLGYNEELMDRCQTLKEYMIFVDKVWRYHQGLPFAEAVEYAVDESIKEGILAEFLRKHKSEVISVSIFEYDEERHLRQEREEAWSKGREEGEKRINTLHEWLIRDQRMEDLKRTFKDREYQERLMEEYGIE